MAATHLGRALGALAALVGVVHAADPWYPYSATNWSQTAPSANPVCAQGHMQSPIDLPLCKQKDTNRPAITVNWGTSSAGGVELFNNGHTVQVSVVGTAGKMSAGGSVYSLVQCHWHWGSEHTIGGVQQPMALHCVHTKDTWPGRYGVLGIFYQIGSQSDSFLAQIQDALPAGGRRLATKVVSPFTGPLNWDLAYSGLNLSEYWTYKGSFTTPPCTEAVDWYPLMAKKSLTQTQFNKMKAAMGHTDEGGNYRPPQPLFSRDVQGCSQEDWYQYKESSWALRVSPDAASNVCRAGKFQSPIDLPACSGSRVVQRPAISVTWGSQPVQLLNNGHTVQLTLAAGGAAPAKMRAAGASYTLLQCHFHWGSEHTVGGYQYPLAAHCVHSKDNTSRYGVLGIFYEVGPVADPFLAQFEGQLPASPLSVSARRLDDVTVASYTGPVNFDLLHTGIDKTQYWTYPGSLTTPPCSEVVDWYPLMDSQQLTQAQLGKFKTAIGWANEGGNYRPPQPLSGRLVEGCQMDWYPYDTTQWARGVDKASDTCARGHMQSPIDLPTCENAAERPALALSWGKQPVQLVNNGHAVQMNVKGSPGRMALGNTTYTHVQCHWHWGSEHFVGGVQLPLAMHCVHTLDQVSGRYGVLGVLYQLGTAGNNFLGQIAAALPAVPSAGSALTVSPFSGTLDLDSMHAALAKTRYWTYDGSFTTPPCTEVVDWYVLMDRASISAGQLSAFTSALGWAAAKGNFRPPQPLYGRLVQGCVGSDWYPYGATKWAKQVATAGLTCATGAFQSPIDLPPCDGGDILQRPAIQLSWGVQTFDLTNNGHTVQLTVTGSVLGNMTAAGAQYTLVQCHVHWGSEHTVGGQQFPMAMHCVHKKVGTSRYGVLGILYDVSSSADAFLQLIEDQLPTSAHAANPESGHADAATNMSAFHGPLNFDLLHTSLDKTRYWTYPGSLTTPPCSEVVDWYPLMTRAVLTQAQLDKFEAAIGWAAAGGNYRPPQPLSGRLVEGCRLRWYPYDTGAWAAGVDKANEVCRSGKMQSPIDLPLCALADAMPAISVAWGSAAVRLTNNGHAVQLSPNGSGSGGMTIAGVAYTLVQCHWHWGSEHTVAGVQQDMVVHCVHTKDGTGGARYGVLGIFYSVSKKNDFLSQFEDQLPAQVPEGANASVSAFGATVNWDGLHANLSKTRYWSYNGSFTTPPCTEIVDWFVLMDVAPLSKLQLGKFSQAMGWRSANGNFRPPQPLAGRPVLGCAYRSLYPYDAGSWSTAVENAAPLCAAGAFQSPVDLPACSAPLARPPLQTTWGSGPVVLRHNGHAVQLSAAFATGQLTTPTGDTYTLVQCHFHYGSENTVGGAQLDLELHCVHTKDTEPGWLAVFGVMYAADPQAAPNPFLASFADKLPSRPSSPLVPSVSPFQGPLDFDSLHAGLSKTRYWSYKGSLTTPPCSEVVDWFVLMDKATISPAQLQSLRSATGSWAGSGNFRPPQPLMGRVVAGCLPGAPAPTPPVTEQRASSARPAAVLHALPLALASLLAAAAFAR